MRAQEFIIEYDQQKNVDEDWRKWTAGAAMAGAAALGGYQGMKRPVEPIQQVQKTPPIENPAATPPPVIPKIEPIEPTPNVPRTTSIKDIIVKVAIDNDLKGPELAQFLAQCAHESANFRQMEENLNYSRQALRKTFPSLFPNDQIAAQYEGKPQLIANYVYANRLGNGDFKSGDGWRYRGRGFIHLTGKYNYQKAGEALGINLVDNPDLAADPEIAADIALWYWKIRVKPKVSGKYSDTRQVTRQINPGMQGLQKRQQEFNKYKQEIVYRNK